MPRWCDTGRTLPLVGRLAQQSGALVPRSALALRRSGRKEHGRRTARPSEKELVTRCSSTNAGQARCSCGASPNSVGRAGAAIRGRWENLADGPKTTRRSRNGADRFFAFQALPRVDEAMDSRLNARPVLSLLLRIRVPLLPRAAVDRGAGCTPSSHNDAARSGTAVPAEHRARKSSTKTRVQEGSETLCL